MKGFFTLFGKTIPYYGLLMIGGFFLGTILALFRAKKYELDKAEIIYSASFASVGGIIGAKLLSILTSLNFIIEYQLSIIDILQNGFVFYGGLLGGGIGLFIYVKVFHCDAIKYFDIFAVSVPVGHALGRIGCFLSGCCYGIEHDGFLSFTYTQAYNLDTPLNVPLLPVQLIESALLFLLYAVLEILFYKNKRKGLCLIVYLFAYPFIRFVLEFFRGDVLRGIYFGLSTSQWISLAIMAVTATILFIRAIQAKGKSEKFK